MFDLAALPTEFGDIQDTMEVSAAALQGRRARKLVQKKSLRQRIFGPAWRNGAAPGPSGARNAL
eukprot:3498633-Prorocentrum_lima.AAC.1